VCRACSVSTCIGTTMTVCVHCQCGALAKPCVHQVSVHTPVRCRAANFDGAVLCAVSGHAGLRHTRLHNVVAAFPPNPQRNLVDTPGSTCTPAVHKQGRAELGARLLERRQPNMQDGQCSVFPCKHCLNDRQRTSAQSMKVPASLCLMSRSCVNSLAMYLGRLSRTVHSHGERALASTLNHGLA
jgi:hypothetical protein